MTNHKQLEKLSVDKWAEIRAEVEQEINAVAVNSDREAMPPNIGILIPSIDLQKPIDRIMALLTKERERVISEVVGVIDGLKADTNLLGCEKHWSDGNGPCTCDENERTANRFYAQAKDDIKRQLKGLERP